jgi:hypothetical protein
MLPTTTGRITHRCGTWDLGLASAPVSVPGPGMRNCAANSGHECGSSYGLETLLGVKKYIGVWQDASPLRLRPSSGSALGQPFSSGWSFREADHNRKR